MNCKQDGAQLNLQEGLYCSHHQGWALCSVLSPRSVPIDFNKFGVPCTNPKVISCSNLLIKNRTGWFSAHPQLSSINARKRVNDLSLIITLVLHLFLFSYTILLYSQFHSISFIAVHTLPRTKPNSQLSGTQFLLQLSGTKLLPQLSETKFFLQLSRTSFSFSFHFCQVNYYSSFPAPSLSLYSYHAVLTSPPRSKRNLAKKDNGNLATRDDTETLFLEGGYLGSGAGFFFTTV